MNICLAFAKFLGGILSGSVGLIADGIHSSSDIVASIALFLGVRLSNRKTKLFPFGMYKLENLISLFTSFAIFFAGYEIVREVIFVKKSYELTHIAFAITIEILAVLVTYLFSAYEAKIGKIEESPALISDSKHVRSDMLSSIIIITGLIGAFLNIKYLDKAAAVVVALLIFKAGYEVALDSIRVLLDASVDYKTLDRMKEIIRMSPFVKEIKEVNGRNSGSYKFLEAVISLKTENLEKAHRIVSEIENGIKKEIPHVDSVIIHYEPVEKKEQIVAVPINNPDSISDEFGSAPYFLFLYFYNKKLIKEEIIANLNKNNAKGKGISTAEWLAKRGIDVIFLKKDLKSIGPKYLFEDYDIDVRVDPDITINQIKEDFTYEKK
jgi:cation diffusion facilitator family transporter